MMNTFLIIVMKISLLFVFADCRDFICVIPIEQDGVITVLFQERNLVIYKKINPNNGKITQECSILELSGYSLVSMNILNLNSHELQSLHNRNLFVHFKTLEMISLMENSFTTDNIILGLVQNNTNLKYFYFSKNSIERIPSRLFSNLTSLQAVTLYSSNLKELSYDLFIDNINLYQLDLANNLLTNLDLRLFQNCKNLQQIDFSRNKFTNFYPEYFILQMSQLFKQAIYNKTIYSNLFSNDTNYLLLPRNLTHDYLLSYLKYDNVKKVEYLTSLVKENYSYPKLYEFLFQQVIKLTSIDLSLNALQHLNVDWFVIFKNLQTIKLSKNNFTLESIPFGLFKNNKMLRQFYLENNKQNLQTVPSGLFSNLKNLEEVVLSGNNLEYLPRGLFFDNNNLKNINLEKNLFKSLHLNIFNSSIISVNINLSHNNVTNIYQDYSTTQDNRTTLSDQQLMVEGKSKQRINISEINLSNNSIKNIPSLEFINSIALKRINLCNNEIKNLTKNIFNDLRSLKYLDLSFNKISSMECNVFDHLDNLLELNMVNNNLQTIQYCQMGRLEKLRVAKFSHNNLTVQNDVQNGGIMRSPFRNWYQIEQLSLDNNRISQFFIDCPTLNGFYLNLSNNQLISFKDIEFVYLYNKINLDVSNNKITTFFTGSQDEIILGENESENKKYIVYKNSYFNLEINANDNPLHCDCNLYYMLPYVVKTLKTLEYKKLKIHIDNLKCNEKSLFPNTSIMELESKTYKCLIDQPNIYNVTCPNKCECWEQPSSKSYIVDCSNKNLNDAPRSLQSLPGHEIKLNLSNNLLTNMPDQSQLGYNLVTVLDLSRNRIKHLSFTSLSKNLKSLFMHNNSISTIETKDFEYFSHLENFTELTLRDNPWECDCHLVSNLPRYLLKKKLSQFEVQKIICQKTKRSIVDVSKEELCPSNLRWIIGICIIVTLLAIFTSFMIVIYYKYQESIKIWLYAKQWFLFWITEEELDKNKNFDAFISFSSKDDDFVINTLISELEEGPQPFKLCVHYRDWQAGEYIPHQITSSIENSRRTIVVLSTNFLESNWAKTEFRTAHCQALNDGRVRVIVIVYNEIPPTENLDQELQSYLKMYTYIKWGDPWFWRKLRYALPHRNRNIPPVS